MMQTLDIHRPNMPNLQFVLLVTALCTSRLALFNVPLALRATIFDRCWSLIHDEPPPTHPEHRVLDLRPWNEVTLEAMMEIIQTGLMEAGINTLAWDHAPSEPTHSSTPAAQTFTDNLEHLYTPASISKEAREELEEESPVARRQKRIKAHDLLGEIATLMSGVPPALKRRAQELSAQNTPRELVDNLLDGAEVMQRSGILYLAWARHYIQLAGDTSEATRDAHEDQSGTSKGGL
jgi:hypothetical protein